MKAAIRSRLPLAAGVFVVGAVVIGAYITQYASPRATLSGEVAVARESVQRLEKQLEGRPALRARLRTVGATTLGGKLDTLEHRFRTGLSRLAEAEGLTSVVVDHGTPQAQPSPLLNAKGIATGLKRELRRAPDFEVVRGVLRGSGSLEQTLRTIAAAQAQPWAHRIEGFSIAPAGKDRERFDLTLRVATIFAPAVAPAPDAAPVVVQTPVEAEPLWRAVAAKNVFRAPPAGKAAEPSVLVADVANAEPPPQPFAPYEEWRLAGVTVSSVRGAEAFFVNVRTGARVTVPKGGLVLDALFVEGSGERAVIEIGGKRFEISNGQTLAARRPLG